MRRRTKKALITVILMAATLGISSVAYALWSDDGEVDIPAVMVGAVSFDGFSQTDPEPQYSPDGSAVTLTLPADEILGVLEQTGLDPQPVIWQFTTQGYAQGITGMNVSVSMGNQIGPDGTTTDLSSGNARSGTILAMSTTKVYPASMTGDCSHVPDTPAGEEKNIYVYDTDDFTLQSPGAYNTDPTTSTQVWCVAMDYNQTPDSVYANEVQAIGIGADGKPHAAIDRWSAVVAFPPSLEPLGVYRNRVDVFGTAQDGTISHASAMYDAMIYPDPANEPDVTIILTPTVTNTNSLFSPT